MPSDDSELLREGCEPFAAYLSDCVGTEIEFMPVSDYAAIVMAMKYDRVQMANLGPVAYIEAVKEAGAEVIAGQIKPGGTRFYHALIIARADSHITDLNGVSFAFVDPLSTSGYLAPRLYIREEGIELGEIAYSGGHPQAILAVQNGTVDAAACSESHFNYAIEEGRIAKGEMDILWRSNPIPGPAIVVSSGMRPALKAKLQECVIAVPQSIAEALHMKCIGFVKVADSDYDEIREMVELQ